MSDVGKQTVLIEFYQKMNMDDICSGSFVKCQSTSQIIEIENIYRKRESRNTNIKMVLIKLVSFRALEMEENSPYDQRLMIEGRIIRDQNMFKY